MRLDKKRNSLCCKFKVKEAGGKAEDLEKTFSETLKCFNFCTLPKSNQREQKINILLLIHVETRR